MMHIRRIYPDKQKSADVLISTKIDLVYIKNLFNAALLVWSDIISCSVWRQARSMKATEQSRKKVNCEIGNFMSFTGGFVVRHNAFGTECPG